MGVVNTKHWFERDLWREKIKEDVQRHLFTYGMARRNQGEIMKQLEQKNVWAFVAKKFAELKKEWNGPDVPIYILPADATNRTLQHEFGGKSGVAFRDQLFLFLLPHLSNEHIYALLIHEYHHVCRLHVDPKDEREYTLIDRIVMEGLAEHAVYERLGSEYVAKWTTYYTEEQLKKFTKKWIVPNMSLRPDDARYRAILYGLSFYPRMLGYAVGYEIVKRASTKKKMIELFAMPSEEIFLL
ncbi:Uncharacterized protein YjaZ [Anoxybacillus pushchinoensis]|uniref:Uncharacterized protein YjaZ n=1 Tax=Anoxybacillus pushchinoensis TaxID=150248 RepID=A0A1I0T290_9BACL|nr:DUF2268 domain-containing protein [Anoxybacillus pushchinoensis]SFA45797.1 Uncharacterized protein YjaZ [Anoxybacillus pushchinoensis]